METDVEMLDTLLALLQQRVPSGMTVLVETEAGFAPTVRDAVELVASMREADE